MKHPNEVEGLTAEELAKKLARTTYGFQKEFYESLVYLYKNEAEADLGRGYKQLALLLASIASKMFLDIVPTMKSIWGICEPKMEKVVVKSTCPECRGDKDYNFLGQICCPKCFGVGVVKEKVNE